jgi:hypothetical protein
MTENYLLLIAKGSLKALQAKFREKGAIYTGIGYAFPKQEEPFLKQLVSELPKARFISQPLGEGNTFDSLREMHKASFFLDKLIAVEREMLIEQEKYHLEEFSEIAINKSLLENQEKEALLALFEERERLKEMIKQTEGIEKTLKRANHPFQMQFIADQSTKFLTTTPPNMPRLVNYFEHGIQKPFIRKGIVGQLVGAGGVGKTHALAQLALSLTMGFPWLGIYPIEKKGHVFMGLGENGEDDIHRLLWKTVKNISNTQEADFFTSNSFYEAEKRLAVSSFTGKDATFIRQGSSTPFYQAFLQELKSKEPIDGWSCIILDPISRFMGSDTENDNAAATHFISLLERLTLELKGHPTVLFGHHMNKSSLSNTSTDQGASRGSSAITDGVRWQANLEKIFSSEEDKNDSMHVRLRVVKSNFTPILPAQLLKKEENGCLKPIHNEQPKILASSQDKRRVAHDN